jgi:tetratricopeptide (TPR) repeat protein
VSNGQSFSGKVYSRVQQSPRMRKSTLYNCLIVITLFCCDTKRDERQLQRELEAINLITGDIALCGSGESRYGTVDFGISCSEKVRANFNLGTALLHSFEYGDAEKVFARVLAEDPDCLMAYWGVAMSNFHPLWAPPTNEELEKGSKVIALGRSLKNNESRESDYLEAVATIFDDWRTLDHKTRVQKFETAAESVYRKYPADNEAAIFYALALKAAADPTDKTFAKARKAGELLKGLFSRQPDHPGVAHYLIHTFDLPELAEMALPAARKYASIAASSAHALHMPSHIFIRLGLWDESIQSNINSMEAARCYAENEGINGHWDEELHGLDYLVYAYLQQARDDKAREQLRYLESMPSVWPPNFKVAYAYAAVPVRYALERKDWKSALALELKPSSFPWNDYPWQRSMVSFGRVLGAVHEKKADVAEASLEELKENHEELVKQGKQYEAGQVQVQIKASEAWIALLEDKNEDAVRLMNEAADLEDATEKHPVTPGEVIPARELLGDMYMEIGEFAKALEAYKIDLKRHAGRLNALQGAGLACQKIGQHEQARTYYQQVLTTVQLSDGSRAGLTTVKSFLKANK